MPSHGGGRAVVFHGDLGESLGSFAVQAMVFEHHCEEIRADLVAVQRADLVQKVPLFVALELAKQCLLRIRCVVL